MPTPLPRPIPHVFLIPELIFQILDYQPVVCEGDVFCSEARTKKTHARTLLSVALACRALSDIALSALWREMNGLIPLLKLLPGYMIVSETDHREQRVRNSVRLAATVYRPNDRLRFEYYARKVRALNLRASPPLPGATPHSTDIHESVYTVLSNALLHPIVPRLQVLHYGKAWTSISIVELSHLITPSLQYLSLNLPPAYEILLLELRGILARNPGIPKVELSGHIPVQQAFIRSLKDLTDLTALKIDSTRLDPGLLHTLGSFSTLRDLTLVLVGSCKPVFSTNDVDLASCPLLNLETLKITGGNEEVSTMLEHVSPWTLRKLDVEYWYSFSTQGKIDVARHIRETPSWMSQLCRFKEVKEVNISLSLFNDLDDCGSKEPLHLSELLEPFPSVLTPLSIRLRVPRWIQMQSDTWSRWSSVSSLDLAYNQCEWQDSDADLESRYIPVIVLQSVAEH